MTTSMILAGVSVILLLCSGVLIATGLWANRMVKSYKKISMFFKSELDAAEIKENYYELVLEAMLRLMRDIVQDATDTARTQTNIYRLLNVVSTLENRSDIKNVYLKVDRTMKQDMLTLESALCEVMKRYYSYDGKEEALTRLIDKMLYTMVEQYDAAKNGSSITYQLMVNQIKACGITIRKPASHKTYQVQMPEPDSDLWDVVNPHLVKFLKIAEDMNIDWKSILPNEEPEEDDSTETIETVDRSGATVIHVAEEAVQ